MAGNYTQNPWSGITAQTSWLGQKSGVTFSVLVDELERLTQVAKSKIAQIRSKRSAMSIADMFDLQMAMNKLSQFSEMSTSVVQAMQSACMSMTRGIKA
jgi:hypothetical protein